MTTFFIGDTHFGHTNILTFEAQHRPFYSVEEMNETLVDNWNKVVTKQDKVWHLGDAVFGAQNAHYLGRLNGQKYLIMGNHDTLDMQTYLKYFGKVYGAKSICVSKEVKIILTHIPTHTNQFSSRFRLNIHGHLHSKFVMDTHKKEVEDMRYFNCSCERIELKPIALDEILLEKGLA